MITLDDRLHEAGDDLRHAAAHIPARHLPHPRGGLRRAAGWVGAAAGIGALIALPLWLGMASTPPESPPVGGESESSFPDVQRSVSPFGLDEAHIIVELTPGLSAEDAEALGAMLSLFPEVEDVAIVTRDEAVAEWLELRAATFGDDEASIQGAIAEVGASIRLLVHEETDRIALGEAIAGQLLRQEGQSEPHPVIRVVVNMNDEP